MDVPPGYKRTEVGVIPVDWEAKPLGPYVTITSGESPSKFQFGSSGTPYFKVEQLNNSNKFLDSSTTEYFIVGYCKNIPQGSVLFPKRGASIMLNKIRLLEENAYLDTNMMALTPKGDLDSEYLYYSLTYIQLWTLADATSIPQINNKHINPLVIPIPTLREQAAIANTLSDVDSLIQSLDKLIAKKRDIKKAAMQQLLTGKTRLPGFTGVWSDVSLGKTGTCYRGVSYKPDDDLSVSDQEYTIRLLRSNNIKDASITLADVQYVHKRRVVSEQIMQPGDLLVCMANGSKELVGKVAHFHVDDGFEYTFGAFMGCFRTHPVAADHRYVGYLMQTAQFRDHIGIILSGSSINNLKPSDIEAAAFEIPGIQEQQTIASVLSDMDSEIVALEKRRDKTRQIKQGMMQELLTGKTRLI